MYVIKVLYHDIEVCFSLMKTSNYLKKGTLLGVGAEQVWSGCWHSARQQKSTLDWWAPVLVQLLLMAVLICPRPFPFLSLFSQLKSDTRSVCVKLSHICKVIIDQCFLNSPREVCLGPQRTLTTAGSNPVLGTNPLKHCVLPYKVGFFCCCFVMLVCFLLCHTCTITSVYK